MQESRTGPASEQSPSWMWCEGVGHPVEIYFPYNPAIAGKLRTIPGHRPQRSIGTHMFPFASLPKVITFADSHGIPVPDEVRSLAALAAPPPPVRAANSPNVYLDGDGALCIAVDRDPQLDAELADINFGDSTWNAARYIHQVPAHSPDRLRDIIERYELTVSQAAQDVIEAESARQERNRQLSSQITADGPIPDIPGFAFDQNLLAQQWPAIQFAVTNRRVILGDEPGWGKTPEALATIALTRSYPAIVVCRPSLVPNWAEEIDKFFPYVEVFIADGQQPRPIPAGTSIVIIGTAVLGTTDPDTGAFPWVQTLKRFGPKALIHDEGQDGKESSANRSQAIEELATQIIEQDGVVANLTGTAVMNGPQDLAQQLATLGLLDLFGGKQSFMWRYCTSPEEKANVRRQRPTYTGSDNLEELGDRLAAWGIMVRRTDDQALGLLPLQEHTITLTSDRLDPEAMAAYRRAERDVIGYLADEAEKIARQLGVNPQHARVRAAMKAKSAEHLVRINTLRRLIGAAKRPFITEWVTSQVRNGEKVMIAAHHREEVTHYADTFGGLKIQGGQSAASKHQDKTRFQTDPNAKVIAVAIDAGGVGHTLTAARIGIQAEWPWGPGGQRQMMKRMHRIGQTRECHYYRTLAEDTIDQYMADVVARKQAILDAVLNRKAIAPADDSSAVAEVAWALTQRGFGGRA